MPSNSTVRAQPTGAPTSRIDRDEIEWATARGGRLHIIEHADGSVTFTKAHRDECLFIITSTGTQNCDVEDAADAHRQLGR